MKEKIEKIVRKAAQDAHAAGELNSGDFGSVDIEEPRDASHGDFATNFALAGAAVQKMPPRKIAQAVLNHADDPDGIIFKTEIAGPGFINFFVKARAWLIFLQDIHEKKDRYGAADLGKGRRVQVEFVSANPTGPLHVGHGRGALTGDAIASILSFTGFDVDREYYINDAGRQIRTLGISVYLRCLEISGHTVDFPENAYQGEYIYDIARSLLDEEKDDLLSKDKDEAIDFAAQYAAARILENIRADLDELGVWFDTWFSEQSLYDSGGVDEAIGIFREKKLVYESDGALWFKSSAFGDEKDRVVVRSNGQTTYFASDIAYHMDKYDRGYDRVIDVWGADHHGYVPRLTAAVAAMNRKPEQFTVVLAQLVNLMRQGEPVSMSTRAGQFVTLREVVDEVGRDAVRFIFLTRHHESPLDFDLELAKQKSNDNPVYYVQYVYARISSIMKKAAENNISTDGIDESALSRLTHTEEIQLVKHLAKYPEIIAGAAASMEPHRVAYYLMELASLFHAYYNKHKVITGDIELSSGRLCLVTGVRIVIGNGLKLLGVSAPESM